MQVELGEEAIKRLRDSIDDGPLTGVEGHVLEALEEHIAWTVEKSEQRIADAEKSGDEDLEGIKAWQDGYLCGAATAHALARNVVMLIGLAVPPADIPYRALIPGSQKDAGV